MRFTPTKAATRGASWSSMVNLLARQGVIVSEARRQNPYAGNPSYVELADSSFGYRSIKIN